MSTAAPAHTRTVVEGSLRMNLRESGRAATGMIAERLASPQDIRGRHHRQGWWPQSLAHGAAGVALLHIERAHTGQGPWQRAHDWLACAAAGWGRRGRRPRGRATSRPGTGRPTGSARSRSSAPR